MKTTTLTYVLLIGVLTQLAGAQWDLYFHVHNTFETVLSAPHAVLYAGVLITFIAAAIEMRLDRFIGRGIIALATPEDLSLAARRYWESNHKDTKYLVIGVAMQIFGGAFDAIWHTFFGFDTLLSPTHLIFWSGLLVVAYSTARKYSTSKLAFLGYGALAISGAGFMLILQGSLPEPPIPLWRPPLVWLIIMGFGALLQYLAMRRHFG